MSKQKEGISKYERLIKQICNTGQLRFLNKTEYEGALGVAMVMSILDGVEANVFDLSKHLQISVKELETPYWNLKCKGVFNEKFLNNDKVLRGSLRKSPNQYISAEHSSKTAWCNIAGMASNICGY